MTAAAGCPTSRGIRRTARALRAVRRQYHGFYRRPGALAGAVLTDACLTYGGGVAMFWFHAIAREEQGPPISDPAHWLLDSTLAFVGLLAVVVALLPLATAAAGGWAFAGPARRGVYAMALGVSFAVVTAPGPVVHDLVAGAGTPLAETVTRLAGRDNDVAERNLDAHHHSPADKGAAQVVVGIPVYVGASLVAATLQARHAVRRARLRPLPAPGHPAEPVPELSPPQAA